jgi:hypothetical protein
VAAPAAAAPAAAAAPPAAAPVAAAAPAAGAAASESDYETADTAIVESDQAVYRSPAVAALAAAAGAEVTSKGSRPGAPEQPPPLQQ